MRHISNEPYQTVFNEVCQIYESTVLRSEHHQDREKTEAIFAMGSRISVILSQAEKNGVYGKKLVSKLCSDIREKYGKGPGTSTIRYMRKFAQSYRLEQIHPQLTFSHYCVLLSVADDERRQSLENRAINEKLSRRQLQKLVSQSHKSSSEAYLFPLTPRQGRVNIGKVVHIKGATAPMLDVGFGIEYQPTASAIKHLPCGAFVHRGDNGRWTAVNCDPTERYCYRGTVAGIIDGDTVKMRIQLSATIYITERFRLRGVDAMEMDTREGKRACRALTRMVANVSEFTVYTYHTDRYGRYIADLVTADGLYINRHLVERGYARFLSM
ncbi:MAG: thermonuclease family protein [Deltaproteobacteria bacterium]|nr:thermonuclease family protein [Deltaproteobacteria bacterium]